MRHPQLKCEQARALFEGQQVEEAKVLFALCWKEGVPLNERKTQAAFEVLLRRGTIPANKLARR